MEIKHGWQNTPSSRIRWIARIITMGVSWIGDGYAVSVNGKRLSQKAQSLVEGETLAEEFAKTRVIEAARELGADLWWPSSG